MRKRRQLQLEAKYYISSRINRQEKIMKPKRFKELFLHTVKRAKKKYNFSIMNFCIMSNHVHFLLQPLGTENLSKIMQWILSVFAVRYNIILDLRGHVWYDRFHSKIVSDIKQFIRVFNYIDQNPVMAGIVKKITQFEYSGHRHYLDCRYDILDPPGVLLQLLFPHIVFQQKQLPMN